MKLYLVNETLKQPKVLLVPKTKQSTDYTCGPAALLSILYYYHPTLDLDEMELGDKLGTTYENGTDVQPIVDYCKSHSYNVVSRSMSIQDLKKFIDSGYPVIINFQAWGEAGQDNYKSETIHGHYAVIIGYDGNGFIFMDPTIKSQKSGFISFSDLEDRWHSCLNSNVGIAIIDKPKKPVQQVVQTKKIE